MTEPALTAEEWAVVQRDGCLECYTHDKKIPVDEFTEPEDITRHGLAALCLYGQPFGFTWEDVELLREDVFEKRITDRPAVRNLADRIAALLPPREEP